MPEIESYGGTLVAISPQTPETSEDLADANKLTYPVLSDVGARTAESYGLIFELDPSLVPIYENFGIDIPAANGDESYRLPLAATYVIDTDGRVSWSYVSTDYTTRAEPQDILDALAELE